MTAEVRFSEYADQARDKGTGKVTGEGEQSIRNPHRARCWRLPLREWSNVIGKNTQLCTSCGAEVDKVPSVDRPVSPFRKHMGIHKGIGGVDAYIEEMRGR